MIFMIQNILYLLQFALLESSSVNDDLADLKKELSGSTKVNFLLRFYFLVKVEIEYICYNCYGLEPWIWL